MQLVEHQRYGRGKVQKERFDGFELYVEFEDGISRWVRRDEIRFLSETSVLKKDESPKPILSEEQLEDRRILEALRLGVVPHDCIEQFTFGRDEEINHIKNWLSNSDDNNGSLILSGGYGAGKTHFLEYIFSSALRNNWAVSIVELDPNELSFNKPKAIYESIIRSFKFRSKNGGFREFLKEIAKNQNFYKLEEHKYLSRIIEKIRKGTDDEHVWEWIEGEPTWYYYPPMYKYSTCANIYCYILSGIGWAAKNILGMNGFLILFDEAESVDPFWYSSYQNNKTWNSLKGLILMVNNDDLTLREVRDSKFYEHSIYRGCWGDYTDMQYCGFMHLPFIWKIPSSVKNIFTFTAPIPLILERKPLNNVERFEIESLTDIDILKKIFRNIEILYSKAYSFKINKDLSEQLFHKVLDFLNKSHNSHIRYFIKAVVEAFDLMRFHPDKSIEELFR